MTRGAGGSFRSSWIDPTRCLGADRIARSQTIAVRDVWRPLVALTINLALIGSGVEFVSVGHLECKGIVLAPFRNLRGFNRTTDFLPEPCAGALHQVQCNDDAYNQSCNGHDAKPGPPQPSRFLDLLACVIFRLAHDLFNLLLQVDQQDGAPRYRTGQPAGQVSSLRPGASSPA